MFNAGDVVNRAASKIKLRMLASRNGMLKLISFSAAAALTFRFLYSTEAAVAMLAKEDAPSGYTLRKTPAHNEQLVSVILLTRHGARTPLHVISGLEEVFYLAFFHSNFILINLLYLKPIGNVTNVFPVEYFE
jgi:hypothetical protein